MPAPTQSAFAQMLLEARHENVSAAQLDVLERAVDTGKLPYSDIEALVDDAFDCFEAGGIEFDPLPPTYTSDGVLVPNFATHDNPNIEDGGESIVYECSLRTYGIALAA